MDRLTRQAWMSSPGSGRVLDALEAVGGRDCARFVGGCVRNAVLDRPVADIDIATQLEPQTVLQSLAESGIRAVPTGLAHGTVTAIVDHQPFEITSLRRDVETDGRRAVVAFTREWAEDASRRDFRLNALYADRDGRLYDYVGGGVDDALAGRIVFVGEPEQRLGEDYLRILRFFRFYAWYGRGDPDPAGLAACARLAPHLTSLSAERISAELIKLLSAEDPAPALDAMQAAGVLDPILPSGRNSARAKAMLALSKDPLLRLSALLPDDPQTVAGAAKALRLSNDACARLTAALPGPPTVELAMDDRAARAAIYQLGAHVFKDRVLRAWSEALDHKEKARRLLRLADVWAPPKFPLGGAEAISAGVTPGPELGRLLREVELWWIDNDFPEVGAHETLQALSRR